MSEKSARKGTVLYEEGEIEIRDFNLFSGNVYDKNVWVGKDYFLLKKDILDKLIEGTPTNDLERALKIYSPNLYFTLSEKGVSPERFVLMLARARVEEKKSMIKILNKRVSDKFDSEYKLK